MKAEPDESDGAEFTGSKPPIPGLRWGYSPQLHSRSRTTLWAELHSDEQNYTFDPLSDVIRSNWLQVALMSGLPIGIDQHPTDMPSPQ